MARLAWNRVRATWKQLALDLSPKTNPPTQLLTEIPTSHNIPNPYEPLTTNKHQLHQQPPGPAINTKHPNKLKTYKDYKQLSDSYYPHMITSHAANTGARPPTYNSNY